MKVEWCDRALTVCAYYYCLCTSVDMFRKELERLEIPPQEWGQFTKGGDFARTHYWTSHNGKPIAIVCINGEESKKYTGIQICALLCHEAVHIWQAHADFIGAGNDHGSEEEAYAIQNIAQSLMESFALQMKLV